MAPVLRSACSADVDALMELWAAGAHQGARATDTRAAVARLVAHDPEAVIVAEDGGALLGCVVAGWDGWRCHLYRLAVRPDRRRQGLGAGLIAAAERRFAALGGQRADAMVLNANEVGRAAWAGAGYRREDDNARWVKPL